MSIWLPIRAVQGQRNTCIQVPTHHPCLFLSDLLISPASCAPVWFPEHPKHTTEQVLAARDHVPHAYFKYLFESLLGTVRDGFAECSEVRTRKCHLLFLAAPACSLVLVA